MQVLYHEDLANHVGPALNSDCGNTMADAREEKKKKMMNDEEKKRKKTRMSGRAEKTICNTIWQFLVFLAGIFKQRLENVYRKALQIPQNGCNYFFYLAYSDCRPLI